MSERSLFSRIVGIPLHWQIAVALVLAALVGWLADETTTLFGASLLAIFDFFGGLFLDALKMIVVPLILSSIIVGVRNMASRGAFGRVGGKTLGLYLATALLSILTGLLLVNLIAPGESESARALAAAPARRIPGYGQGGRAWRRRPSGGDQAGRAIEHIPGGA